MAKILDEVDMDYGMTVVAQTDNCCVMKMENETGEGIMTQYSVFPGAFIVFNDFHMKNWYSGLRSDDTRLLQDGCYGAGFFRGHLLLPRRRGHQH